MLITVLEKVFMNRITNYMKKNIVKKLDDLIKKNNKKVGL